MKISLKDSMAPYPTLSLADEAENNEILDFLDSISMETERGGISIHRRPNFFKLCHIQGHRYFVITMRNPDLTLSGVAVLTLSQMKIHGEIQVMMYTSDLRASPKMHRKTRLEYHKWYEILVRDSHLIEEFEGCKYVITSVFDENTAARRALVEGSHGKKREPTYTPVFPYTTYNVLGKNPFKKHFAQKVQQIDPKAELELLKFLVLNPYESEFVWSEAELKRKLQLLKINLSDFLVIRDEDQKIIACTVVTTDMEYRKMVLKNLQTSLRMIGGLLPLLGRPSFKENQPLHTGYLAFLKTKHQSQSLRVDLVSSFLEHVMNSQKQLPSHQRLHTLSFFETQDKDFEQQFRKRGWFYLKLPATIYQVSHGDSSNTSNKMNFSENRLPDFEVSVM